MTKIQIIGNSHVAALRYGWELISAEFQSVEMNFFAAAGQTYREVSVSRDLKFGLNGFNTKVPQGWNKTREIFGVTEVDLTQADHVIFAGLQIQEHLNIALLNCVSVDGFRPSEGLTRISRNAYDEIADSFVNLALSDCLFGSFQLGSLTFIPSPRPSEAMLKPRTASDKAWTDFNKDPKYGAPEMACYFERVTLGLDRLGYKFCAPPDHVYAANGMTRAHYGVGSLRVDRNLKHPVEEYRHMNAAYGADVLRHVLTSILSRRA